METLQEVFHVQLNETIVDHLWSVDTAQYSKDYILRNVMPSRFWLNARHCVDLSAMDQISGRFQPVEIPRTLSSCWECCCHSIQNPKRNLFLNCLQQRTGISGGTYGYLCDYLTWAEPEEFYAENVRLLHFYFIFCLSKGHVSPNNLYCAYNCHNMRRSLALLADVRHNFKPPLPLTRILATSILSTCLLILPDS